MRSGTCVPGTRISRDSVVYAFREGCSPETIREDFAGLTLAHVYGAIAFYPDRQTEIDAYLLRRRDQWAELERQGTPASADLQARLEDQRQPPPVPAPRERDGRHCAGPSRERHTARDAVSHSS
jgi:uncharacterized protein (DUF433 family)